ncbi:DNA-binding protein [Actinomadura spongiicola]|uniref:DNA-binding protein n=1 Tax=Actinomadura spongiicola TaxID=2303421 RepID=A0A372G7U0_9ACTN|nr:DNA-binding protein [Actinomadura spongiicola]
MKTATRSKEMLTLAEVCAEIKISRSTFYEWRAKGCAPKCYKIDNGEIRVSRDDLNQWWSERRDAA